MEKIIYKCMTKASDRENDGQDTLLTGQNQNEQA